MTDLTTSTPSAPIADDHGGTIPRPRRFLDWSHPSLPVAPLLLVGVSLGPQGLNVLTPAVLGALDPAVPVALAALGCLLWLELPPRSAFRWTAAAAAVVQGAVTTALVAWGFVVLTQIGSISLTPQWLWPVSVGLCAAASWVPPSRDPSHFRQRDEWSVVIETIAALVIGAGIGTASRVLSMPGAVSGFAQSAGIVVLLAAAGWQLVRHTAGPTEGRVFAVGTVLLVGGMADYLAYSPLLGGLAAGVLWQTLGGSSREILHREVRYAHHPFVVLASIVAGARVDVTPLAFGLAAGYACARLVARLLGEGILRRTLQPTPVHLARPPMAAGLMGVALALTFQRALGFDHVLASTILSVVVLGTMLADPLAQVASKRDTP